MTRYFCLRNRNCRSTSSGVLMPPFSHVILVAEDALGLALGRRMIQEHPSLTVWREFNARGNEGIRMNIDKYGQVARRGLPILALTDLDTRLCCR